MVSFRRLFHYAAFVVLRAGSLVCLAVAVVVLAGG
jgi:hypothetical protein